MEEIEDPTERLKETMEAAEEKSEAKERWTLNVALSTAIIAVLAAIAGMLGNHHGNEAVLDQINASNHWSHYQAKSIKSELSTATSQILAALDKPVPTESSDKIARYEKEKEDIKADAEEAKASSSHHLAQHIVFSTSVTIFQIAIALSAISILTRKKPMWFVSLGLAVAACVFMVMGFLVH